MSILSIVLCIALITAVIPHFLYNNDSTQDSAVANTSQTKYADITAFQSDGKVEWTKTFENLQAGTYDFKVQANTSWAYNYNENGFNGNQNI